MRLRKQSEHTKYPAGTEAVEPESEPVGLWLLFPRPDELADERTAGCLEQH